MRPFGHAGLGPVFRKFTASTGVAQVIWPGVAPSFPTGERRMPAQGGQVDAAEALGSPGASRFACVRWRHGYPREEAVRQQDDRLWHVDSEKSLDVERLEAAQRQEDPPEEHRSEYAEGVN
jgi:hypothetical protein